MDVGAGNMVAFCHGALRRRALVLEVREDQVGLGIFAEHHRTNFTKSSGAAVDAGGSFPTVWLAFLRRSQLTLHLESVVACGGLCRPAVHPEQAGWR